MSARFVPSVVFAAGLLSLIANSASAQFPSIVQKDNMVVLNAQMPDKTYRFLGSSAPGQIFFLDEPVDVNLAFAKTVGTGPLTGFGVEIQQFSTSDPAQTIKGTTGFLGSGEETRLQLLGKPVEFPITVTMTDKDPTPFTLSGVPIPHRFGVFALILTRGPLRQFLGTVARVPQPRPTGNIENTPLFGDGSFFDRIDRFGVRAQTYARLGIHGFRGEAAWSEVAKGQYDWSRTDPLFAALKANNIKEMVTLEGHPWAYLPFGEPTPAAGYTDTPYSGHGDWLVAPELYPLYGKWVSAFCNRYWDDGKGAIWALENYNEPWEGGGITGWARDMVQYRALQKLIATAAHEVSPDIKIAAASSIMNTEDKLYPDGSKEFDPYIDIFTDHYVSPPMCYGPMVARAHGKHSQESETWFADAEYKLPLVAATFTASGQERLAPWQPGEIFDTLPGSDDPYLLPNPVSTATAAFNFFVTGKPFQRLVFKDHLPWVFQYGSDTDKSAVLLLFGQLTSATEGDPKSVLWSQVDSSPGGTITIDNHDGLLQFYDLSGNPIFKGRKSVTLPLTVSPTYIQCGKGPGAAAARLALATITNKRPVQITPHDFTTPVGSPGLALTVDVHNCLPQGITGTLSVTGPTGMTPPGATQPVTLRGGETKAIIFPLTGTVNAANTYPFSFHFASAAGNADYSEVLNQVVAVHRTINVDGSLDDWKDIPGVVVVAKAQGIDPGELARRPWTDLHNLQPNGSYAEIKTAWDSNYFYISARVNSATPQTDKERLATRSDDSYFHTAADDKKPFYKEFLAKHPGHSFAEVPFVYAKSPEPGLAFRGDHVQIAFDTTPGFHDMDGDADRVPLYFHAVPDTDYEYSAYRCADGTGELWRMLAPGVPRIHDFPRQPKGARTTGLVPGGKFEVRDDGSTRSYEIAIPSSELAELKLVPGTTFGFSFRVGQNSGPSMDYGTDKAITKTNGLTFHPYWEFKPSCTIRWILGE